MRVNIFEELNIRPYINAHDTYTVYGGSRMSAETLEAMRQISEHFVDFTQLQKVVGEKIAALTHNEAAYVTNGAAGAIQLATAVCLARGDVYRYMRLPETDGPNEVVVIHAQHNAYDKAIAAAGAKIVFVGDADETLETQISGALRKETAAVFYFVNRQYDRAAPALETVIELAHEKGVPVIVDAAAQLPPVENLWTFTEKGADMVIFSGGKTLCGPQDSGLILGRADLLADCHRFGPPEHGVCRACKTSREAVVGLLIALRNYVHMDHAENKQRMSAINEKIAQILSEVGISSRTVFYGPVGQQYPRLFVNPPETMDVTRLVTKMRECGIYIGCDRMNNALYISPLNLTEEEAEIVGRTLLACMQGELR